MTTYDMVKERIDFEAMIEKTLRGYFKDRVQDLVTGKILIEDTGTMLRIRYKNNEKFDIGIVY